MSFSPTYKHRIVAGILVYAILLQYTVPFARNVFFGNPAFPLESPPESFIPFTNEAILPEVLEELPVSDNNLPAVTSTVSASAASTGGDGFSINAPDNLVDPFTGDFNYSIPLMDVEGYPVVLNYNSNVTEASQASWVGLGWNLNLGSVEREMRGIPDEFDGSQSLVRESNQREDLTVGVKFGKYWGIGVNLNLTDLVSVNLGFNHSKLKGSYTNSYLGQGITLDKSNAFDVGLGITLDFVGIQVGGGFGNQKSYDSRRGVNLGHGGGLSGGLSVFGFGGQLSTYQNKNFNSRQGMTGKAITRGWSANLMLASWATSHTSTITYGTQTMLPRAQAFSHSLGSTNTQDKYTNFLLFTLGKMIEGYSTHTTQVQDNYKIYQPAIGFLHASKNIASGGTVIPVRDYNRSADTRFSEEMAALPFSSQTFDIFYANGAGMQGTFRAARTDAGTYFDSKSSDVSMELSVLQRKGMNFAPFEWEKELGTGVTSMVSATDKFAKGNGAAVLEFNTSVNSRSGFDDAVYFKGVGEPTYTDNSLYASLGGLAAGSADVVANQGAESITLQPTVKINGGGTYSLPTSGITTLSNPEIATFFRPVTNTELLGSANAYDQNKYSYGPGANPVISTVSRSLDDPKAIGKVEVVGPDGSYYGYGLPVYETSSQATFNVGSEDGSPSLASKLGDGLIYFDVGDNTVSNSKGLSHYYEKTTLPEFANSFLLTDMHGPDYIDRTGDGPSVDDIGSYYRFNYTLSNASHNWRMPFNGRWAYYSEGTWGSEQDDMGSYSYGNKEVWVARSVESKNYIAEFVLETQARADAVGCNESGVVAGDNLYALHQVILYSKADRLQNGASAVPIQIVEFTYDYSLCQNAPGNTNSAGNNGKLTLKAVKIYSGKSNLLSHSYYKFDYGSTAADNPAFSNSKMDGWGNYKDGLQPQLSRLPYSEQNSTLANSYAQAWKLKKITTPESGTLEVSYEADRYGKVQNKRAMNNVNFTGLTNVYSLLDFQTAGSFSTSGLTSAFVSDAASLSPPAVFIGDYWTGYEMQEGAQMDRFHVPNNVIVFKLNEDIPFSTADPNQKVKEAYFQDNGSTLQELYIKSNVLISPLTVPGRTEKVELYAKISDDLQFPFMPVSGTSIPTSMDAIGVMPLEPGHSNYSYGYVIVSSKVVHRDTPDEDLGDGDDANDADFLTDVAFQPIQAFAFDYFQRSLPDIVYANPGLNPDIAPALDLMAGARMDINIAMQALDFAPQLSAGYNSIRLYDHDNVKFGGNARVSKIVQTDNWHAISGEYDGAYEWDYIYDIVPDANSQTPVSTGVASFESRPTIDESAFHSWDTYYDIRVRFPDQMNYIVEPAMEMLYPSGCVGYSTVAVKCGTVNSPDRGYFIHKFYTAADFQTRTDRTNMNVASVEKIHKNTGRTIKKVALSQGYSIETNDFHGKPKSTTIYKGDLQNDLSGGEILASTRYDYYGLSDQQKVSDRSGNLSGLYLGREYDIHAESRKIYNETNSSYVGLQKAWPIPSIIPVKHHTHNDSYGYFEFNVHTLVKHSNVSAILKSVTTEYSGAINTAKNLVFDRGSGQVIVSSVSDEFEDELYSVSRPAYWYYTELRDVASKLDKSFSISVTGPNMVTSSSSVAFLSPGDKIRFADGSFAWVGKAYPWPTSTQYFLIDANGSPVSKSTGSYVVSIVSSGRTNQLGATMEEFTTKKNPVSGSAISVDATAILSASAVTFRDRLNAVCSNPATNPAFNNNAIQPGLVNPYLFGFRGKLVPDQVYSWQSERLQATADGVRKDGSYTSFTPFYGMASGVWYPLTHPSNPNYSGGSISSWRPNGETTLFDQYGRSIEHRDDLLINSAQLYGYNPLLQLVPVAQAANAHKQDIAFDGFEDYSFYTTPMMSFEPHFNFSKSDGKALVIDNTIRHSGRASAPIAAGTYIQSIKLVSSFQTAATLHTDSQANAASVQTCDCINRFSPSVGDYVVSVWLSQSANDQGQVIVEQYNSANALISSSTSTTSDTKLDGWQRVDGRFTMLATTTKIIVKINNPGASGIMYADDFRIHPLKAAMTTVVYDPKTLLRIASHDTENYTTFYNYDENYNLVRVRIENSEGIKTVSETEMSLYKTN